MSSTSHNVLLISDAMDAKAVRDALIGSNDGLFKIDWLSEPLTAAEFTGLLRRKEAQTASATSVV